MKYYVVTFLGEDIDDGAFCSVCGVYTDLKSAKAKMADVVEIEEKCLTENDLHYEKEESETKVEFYASDGDWSYTINIDFCEQ